MRTTHRPAVEPSRSVRIGRIAVRVGIAAIVLWGGTALYDGWRQRQRAHEIAPLHAYAERFYRLLKHERYFQAQAMLSPQMQHQISIDRIAHFVQESTLSQTQKGRWGEWNRTKEANATLYQMQGNLFDAHQHAVSMEWRMQKQGDTLSVQDLKIGKQTLRPQDQSGL